MQSTTMNGLDSSASSSSSAAASRGAQTTRKIAVLAAIALAAFLPYSLWVVYTAGPVGFLPLAWREPWGMQLLLDLVLAVSIALSWLVPDAKRRGLAWWPYVAFSALGSPTLLFYLVRRAFAPEPTKA